MRMTIVMLAAILSPVVACAGSEADFVGALNGIEASAVKEAKALSLNAQSALPPARGGETVVRDETTIVPVKLDASTVKCSAADYQMPMLKVLVPALAELTVLNHRNTREGAPCVAAGRCGPIGPQDILKSGEGVDDISVRVVLKKVAALDGESCHVSLVESVTTSVRGVSFFHERAQNVADRAAADCR